MTRPRDEPEGLFSTQTKLVFGAALAIGLQLGLFQAFIFGTLRPLISTTVGSLIFGAVTLLIWQTVFPRLRGLSYRRRILAQVLIAVAIVTPLSFVLINGFGFLSGTATMFRPYGGADIDVTIAAAKVSAAPLVFFLLPILPTVLMMVVGFNQSWWQIFLLTRRESQARQLAAAAELNALRAQINPHFLFNSLNSIAQLISSEPQRAEECVERLAEIFRYLLHSDNRTFVTLDDELGIADAYLDIERARFGEKLSVDFLVAEEARRHAVPTLILQPLLENAVRHGISQKIGGGTVSIEAALAGEDLKITVRDTGVGMAKGVEQSLGSGVGLRNVHDRLVFLYGEDYAPQIESRPGLGTSIELRVPPDVAVGESGTVH